MNIERASHFLVQHPQHVAEASAFCNRGRWRSTVRIEEGQDQQLQAKLIMPWPGLENKAVSTAISLAEAAEIVGNAMFAIRPRRKVHKTYGAGSASVGTVVDVRA